MENTNVQEVKMPITYDDLKKIGVVLKRALYFITCSGKLPDGLKITSDGMIRSLMPEGYAAGFADKSGEQLSLLPDPSRVFREDVQKCFTGQI